MAAVHWSCYMHQTSGKINMFPYLRVDTVFKLMLGSHAMPWEAMPRKPVNSTGIWHVLSKCLVHQGRDIFFIFFHTRESDNFVHSKVTTFFTFNPDRGKRQWCPNEAGHLLQWVTKGNNSHSLGRKKETTNSDLQNIFRQMSPW